MSERWKRVPDYNDYKISSHGRVKSYKSSESKILTTTTNHAYPKIGLCNQNGRKHFMVHVLVAKAFIPNLDSLPFIDHIDGDKYNANVTNLRWCTASQNMTYSGITRKKFTTAVIQKDMFGNEINAYESVKEAAIDNDISPSSISNCLSGRTDFTGEFTWEYVNKNEHVKFFTKPEKGEKFKVAVKDCGDKSYDCPRYSISNYGTIVNNETNRVLKHYSNENKYPTVTLINGSSNKLTIFVHLLVATFFVKGRSEQNCVVNHLDEDRSNCRADNLEWCTQRHNVTHSVGKKVEQIDAVSGKVIATFNSMSEASRVIGCAMPNISKVCSGERKLCYGYKWRYV